VRVGLIGCGGLGGAIARGLASEVDLLVCDRHPERIEAAAPGRAATLAGAVAARDVVLVAVKPAHVGGVLADARAHLGPETLVLSLAAGVSLKAIADVVGARQPIARAMPNVGVRARAGASGYVLGEGCDVTRDESRILHVLGVIGTVFRVPREEQLHPVTAVNGSGPAFLMLVVEALVEGGVQAGLPRDIATASALGAVRAGAALLDQGLAPEAIRAAVTSPGGTTAAGLFALEERAVRGAVQAAVLAATDRARTLGSG